MTREEKINALGLTIMGEGDINKAGSEYWEIKFEDVLSAILENGGDIDSMTVLPEFKVLYFEPSHFEVGIKWKIGWDLVTQEDVTIDSLFHIMEVLCKP